MDLDRLRNPEEWKPYIDPESGNRDELCRRCSQRWIRCLDRNGQFLSLMEMKLIDLPLDIAYLENLIKLTLSFNSIKKLPREIGYLKNLKFIWLNENPIDDPELREIYTINADNLPVIELLQSRVKGRLTKSANKN